jgi:transposase-like protein
VIYNFITLDSCVTTLLSWSKDNRTDEENELIELRKRNKQLEMEVDILKQAALIMAKR